MMNVHSVENKKLKDLLDFPCDFMFKVVAYPRENLIKDIVVTIENEISGTYRPKENFSSNKTYVSVSVMVRATNITQIENLYQKLAQIDGVKMVL